MNIFNSVEGVGVIISTMYDHRNDSNIQETGARFLSNFGTNNRIKYILRQNGGLDVLILSIINHIEHLGIYIYIYIYIYSCFLLPSYTTSLEFFSKRVRKHNSLDKST